MDERRGVRERKAFRGGPPLGVHVSVAGGLHNAFSEGLRVGCDCVQIFVKNQRQWKGKPLTDEQVRLFLESQRAAGIGPVIAHANYLLNLASPVEFMRNGSIAVLAPPVAIAAATPRKCLLPTPLPFADGLPPAAMYTSTSTMTSTPTP